jgi:hypothetical protein
MSRSNEAHFLGEESFLRIVTSASHHCILIFCVLALSQIPRFADRGESWFPKNLQFLETGNSLPFWQSFACFGVYRLRML